MKSLNKKGVLGMDLAQKFVLTLLTLAVLGVVAVIVMSNLGTSNGLVAGSTSANATTAITNNISSATEGFFGNATTWFAMLAIAVLILIIAVVIIAVRGFGGGSGNL